jgi:hypothetical protein
MAREDAYETRCRAERMIGEDRVPTEVLKQLIHDYGEATPGQGRGSTYDEVVAEVAKDLRLDEAELREQFGQWINSRWPHEHVQREWGAACYAVYRLTKTRSAFRMAAASRERWRDRAISLGSPPHLLAVWREACRHLKATSIWTLGWAHVRVTYARCA